MLVTKLAAVLNDWLADICGTAYGCPNRCRCWTRRNAYRSSTETAENASTLRRYTPQVCSVLGSMRATR